MSGRPPRSSPWVRLPAPRPGAGLRLFCLNHAGGGAGAYREWGAHLPAGCEVCAIQLPGREDRLTERRLARMDDVLDRLLPEVLGFLDRPFATFGHSMGALIAYELVGRLRTLGLEPIHFFAAACPAPHLPLVHPTRHVMDDRRLLDEVAGLNGTQPALLRNPEFMRLMLPTLRSDFELVETYRYRPRPRLRCPLTAFAGSDDQEVRRNQVEAWMEHAEGSFRVHVLPGDHFFPQASRAALMRLLAPLAAGAAAASEWTAPIG